MRLYIDPGTGSMLFAVLLGVLGVLWFALKGAWLKLKFLLSGGKAKEKDTAGVPLAIFSEGKRYWHVFEPICKELDERGIETVYLTESPDDPALSTPFSHIKTEFIGLGNKAYAKLNLLNARICLATTPGLDVYQWKRSKHVEYYVHMLHALRGVTTYRMFGTEFYDAILTSAEVDNIPIREMEEKRGSKPKELVTVGSVLMDHLAARYAAEKDSGKHEGVNVLLAPSWGPNSIFNRFGDRVIEALLSTGCDITIRPHPQSFTAEKELMDRMQSKYPESEHLHWNRDADNFDVLNRTDLLISDYSSVIFDFAFIFDRPVIYADVRMDWSVYDQSWCDTPNYHLSALPRIGLELKEENFGNMKAVIDNLLQDASYAESRRAVRDECWQHQGEAAKRIADFLVRKNAELILNSNGK